MTEIADEKRFMKRYPGSGIELILEGMVLISNLLGLDVFANQSEVNTTTNGQSIDGCSGADLGIH